MNNYRIRLYDTIAGIAFVVAMLLLLAGIIYLQNIMQEVDNNIYEFKSKLCATNNNSEYIHVAGRDYCSGKEFICNQNLSKCYFVI